MTRPADLVILSTMSLPENSAPGSSQWFVEQCLRVGIKATQQRREIYRELVRTDTHPDVETIFRRVRRRMPAISLDTVYRNLRTLAEQGIIQKVGSTGYRTRFDANMMPHHHFVCTSCGLICDFRDERFSGIAPPRDVLAMGKVDTLYVEFRGTCKQCSQQK